MASQNILIGISIGLFFVGLGVGFAVFSNSDQPMNPFHNQNMFNQMMEQNPQAMTWMMNDPQLKQQMFQQMMQNPNDMMQWMAKDPKHIEQMSMIMKEDHVFMSQMMSTMMNDPELRLQMMGHMSENPEALQQMMKTMSGNITNSYAMSNNTDSMDSKMKDSSMTGNMMNHP